MTAAAAPAPSVHLGLGARISGGILATWAVVTGIAPHVLHHVGPLAGAALLAGFGGKAIFFSLGLVLLVSMLRRLYRRFDTLLAPALAVVAFGAVFAFSSLVIAPLLTGSETPRAPGIEQPAGHESHHSGGGSDRLRRAHDHDLRSGLRRRFPTRAARGESVVVGGAVPVARRQLLKEPAKVAVAVLAVGAAVALVLLLTGLRRGMGEQVTTYLDHQPPVLVGQAGTRDAAAVAGAVALVAALIPVVRVARLEPASVYRRSS